MSLKKDKLAALRRILQKRKRAESELERFQDLVRREEGDIVGSLNEYISGSSMSRADDFIYDLMEFCIEEGYTLEMNPLPEEREDAIEKDDRVYILNKSETEGADPSLVGMYRFVAEYRNTYVVFDETDLTIGTFSKLDYTIALVKKEDGISPGDLVTLVFEDKKASIKDIIFIRATSSEFVVKYFEGDEERFFEKDLWDISKERDV